MPLRWLVTDFRKKRVDPDVESLESDTRWSEKESQKRWDSLSRKINPLKDFAASDDRRSLRLARIGMAVSIALLMLCATTILAFFVAVLVKVFW
jgi:hypothetical protein